MYGSYGSSSNLAGLYGSNASGANQLNGLYNAANTAASWEMPALVISFIIAVLVFFLFLSKRNEGRFIGFAGWLYDFLHFKKLAVEGILKILYITTALFITIMSFTVISTNFGAFLGLLIGGNLGLRIVYELMLVLLIVCKNTSEINKKMSGQQ